MLVRINKEVRCGIFNYISTIFPRDGHDDFGLWPLITKWSMDGLLFKGVKYDEIKHETKREI